MRFRAVGRFWNANLSQQFFRMNLRLMKNVFLGREEEFFELRLAFAVRSNELDHRAECDERGDGGAGMNDRAVLVVEDRVILILAVLREAFAAALASAMESLASEIPAARTLENISAKRGHVAD